MDIKESYTAQFMSVLQSLDSRFFNKVEVDKSSQFMKDKAYLEGALRSIDNGTATTIGEDDFWASTNFVLAKH